MMEQTKLDRINELAHISKERELTKEELAERDTLRKEYIEDWKRSLKDVLDNTYIVDEDGNKHKLSPKEKNAE